MLEIVNGTVYTPTEVIQDGAVLVDGQQIAAVGKRGELTFPQEVERLDAGGGIIVPGFVNMHIHGIGGYDVMDGRVDSLRIMSRLLARHGVTSWVPTTASAPLDVQEAAVVAVRAAMQSGTGGAEILGAHIEGTYLSKQERGAHPAELLLVPNPEEYAGLLELADDIRVFTLAPELPGALDLIKALKERDVLVSAGHSVAIDREFALAVDAGLSHGTHMFCNMGTLRRDNIRRVAGLVESMLLDDRVSTEIISDGHHIAPSLMNLAFKVKGPSKLAIITDSSGLTGLPPGRYTAFGQKVILEEEISYVADRSAFAGSVSTMDQCLRNAVRLMDLSLADAVRMASLTPATLLGVADRKGSLEPGKDADVVVLDDSLQVAHVLVAGRAVDMASSFSLVEGGEFGWMMVQ